MSRATQEFPALPPTAAGPRPEAPPPPASRFTLLAVAAGRERHGTWRGTRGPNAGKQASPLEALQHASRPPPLHQRLLGDLATRACLISAISDPGPRLCVRRTHLLRHRVARLARDIGWGLCYRRPLCLSSPIGPPPDPDTGGEGPRRPRSRWYDQRRLRCRAQHTGRSNRPGRAGIGEGAGFRLTCCAASGLAPHTFR